MKGMGESGGNHSSHYLKYMIDTMLEHLTQTYNSEKKKNSARHSSIQLRFLESSLNWKCDKKWNVEVQSTWKSISSRFACFIWPLNVPTTCKVYHRDRSAWTSVHVATPRHKLRIKLAISHSHSVSTPGQPVLH